MRTKRIEVFMFDVESLCFSCCKVAKKPSLFGNNRKGQIAVKINVNVPVNGSRFSGS